MGRYVDCEGVVTLALAPAAGKYAHDFHMCTLLKVHIIAVDRVVVAVCVLLFAGWPQSSRSGVQHAGASQHKLPVSATPVDG